jgi:hypothetical protein
MGRGSSPLHRDTDGCTLLIAEWHNMFFYRVYGLTIRSDFELPELIEGGDGLDLWIRRGTLTPPALHNSRIQRQGIEALFGGTPEAAYLHWEGVATFCAEAGHILTVDLASDEVDPEKLRLYILSEALGLILHQKGLLLLHASAIRMGDRAVIFAGVPGAGKSTTAAALAQRGHTVLADDMVAIGFEQGQAVVYPAFSQVKIWPTSVQGLGYEEATLTPLFTGSKKRILRQTAPFPTQALPLADIFFLEEGEVSALTPLGHTEVILRFRRFFSCPSDLVQGAAIARHFQQCVQVSRSVPTWTLHRPKSFPALRHVVTGLEEKLCPCGGDRLASTA